MYTVFHATWQRSDRELLIAGGGVDNEGVLTDYGLLENHVPQSNSILQLKQVHMKEAFY
jgi:hypothetical protein